MKITPDVFFFEADESSSDFNFKLSGSFSNLIQDVEVKFGNEPDSRNCQISQENDGVFVTLPGFDMTSANEGSQSLLIRLGQGQPVTGVVQAVLRFVAVMPERITLPISHEYPDPDTGDSFSATQNTSISGNILLTDGATFDTEGFDVTVNGDFILDGGTLRLNGGTLRITGDLRIQGFRREESTIEVRGTSSGRIIMNDGDDHLIVEGDFYMNSTKEHRGSLSAGNGQLRRGILEVRGHFRQDSSGDSRNFSPIDGGDDFRTVVKGSLKTVVLESSQAGFDILEPQNQPLFVESDGSLSNQIPSHNICQISSGSWSVSQELTLQGDLFIKGGQLYLSGKKLQVTNDVVLSAGGITLGNGRLEIGGDLLIQKDSDDNGSLDASSDGFLIMNQPEGHILVEGDFVMDSTKGHSATSNSSDPGDLREGTLEVRGHFTQMSTIDANGYSQQNFRPYDNHRVLLSGTTTQEVTFEDPTLSYFNILEFNNPEVLLNQGITASIWRGQNNSVTLNDPLVIEYRSLTLTSGTTYNLPGIIHRNQTLTLVDGETLTVSGDYLLEGGRLILNGGTLFVTGDLIHSGGELLLLNGRLDVQGDYRLQKDSNGDGEFDTSSDGFIRMYQPNDYILVEGNFVMDSTKGHSATSNSSDPGELREGTLEVRGHFTQMSTIDASGYAQRNFRPYDNHRVLLSGTTTQEVNFEDPTLSYFHILDFNNPVDINLNQGINAASWIGQNNTVTVDDPLLIEHRSFTPTLGITHNLAGVIHRDKNLTLIDGETLTISGDYLLEGGRLILNGGTLIVTGNLIHSGGELLLLNGRLDVQGDYRLQKDSNGDGEFDTSSDGFVRMYQPNDYILVEGNFVMDSTKGHSSATNNSDPGEFRAGTLEVRGHFTQMSTIDASGYAQQNFRPYDNHRVLLSGTTAQQVKFEDAGSSAFHVLDIASDSVELYNFVPHSELSANGNIISGVDGIVFVDSSVRTNFLTPVTIDANFIQREGRLQMGTSTLSITGDYLLEGGYISSEQGRLEIGGDLLIQKDSDDNGSLDASSDGFLIMNQPEGHILVEGDFVMDSTKGHSATSNSSDPGDLREGTLEVRGHFTQMSTINGNGFELQNFQPHDNHRVLLSGTTTQEVTFEDPTISYFYILEFTNPVGIGFLSQIRCLRLFDHHGLNFTLLPDQDGNSFNDYDSDGIRDHLDPFPTTAVEPTVEDAADYSTWADAIGGSMIPTSIQVSLLNPFEDTDSDGLSNLLEFALGQNPLIITPEVIRLDTNPRNPASGLTISLPIRKSAMESFEIKAQLSHSLDFRGTVTELTAYTIIEDLGSTQMIRFEDPNPISGQARRFIRVVAILR